ncbi:Asp-tRNA(Asn)/Glu-tRNA(Gln) amidotransferase GatCAB subunit C [Candidatus Parcubacteria bacterium]|nr:MAG: Asp-tRNA(Asn)/Glu-tRNA(Gln) amidotransferase GatCAB subunit C [Candidatus Parcubacteria bacterium]
MKLQKKDIQHIAKLARLELTEKEYDLYGEQLSGVLEFIDKLSEVNTDNVEPTAQVTGLLNILREDKVMDWNEKEQADAFKEAPNFEDNQYKVKRVL